MFSPIHPSSLEWGAGEEGAWREFEAIPVCGLSSKISVDCPTQVVTCLIDVLLLGFPWAPKKEDIMSIIGESLKFLCLSLYASADGGACLSLSRREEAKKPPGAFVVFLLCSRILGWGSARFWLPICHNCHPPLCPRLGRVRAEHICG